MNQDIRSETDLSPASEPAGVTAGVSPDGAPEAGTPAAAPEADTPATSDERRSVPERPEYVPEKFWDAEKGEPRLEALLKSYRELERKLGRMVALPEGEEDAEGRARLLRALGWPERPEDYEIEPPHPLLERDPELERRLHEAGFTRKQAQLVYDLAAERLLPAVADAVAAVEAERERERLVQHFGGEEAFARIAHQIAKWAEAHLEPEVYEALASSYHGVLALREMMKAAEPELVGEAGAGAMSVSEEELHELMRDPRYWRDHDPEIVARVTEGFRQLYGE